MRARAPDCVVRRRSYSSVEEGASSISFVAAASATVDRRAVLGSSVRDVGKWPAWKLDLCRSRAPERDFGSNERC